MADITLTDGIDLSADLQIRDDSPLAKAKLTKLIATEKQLFGELAQPIDKAKMRSVALGLSAPSPNLLSGDFSLTLGGGINAEMSLRQSADKVLFEDSPGSPVIPIGANEAWLGIELDLVAHGGAGASADGIGVALAATTQVACASFTRFSVPAPPLPLLRDALAEGLGSFSVASSAASIRSQAPNSVKVSDVSGSVSVAVSFQQPFTMNALASADLSFHQTASVQPDVTLEVSGSLEIAGDFVVRSYKMNEQQVRLGVYKKHGSTLTVSLAAGAGIEGDIGSTDVLGALLNAALPGVNAAAAGIAGGNAETLNGVLKAGLDRRLSAQMNATCSAALTHEAAVLYDVFLDQGDAAATDRSLGHVMRGNWTELESLPNARRLRNIAIETVEKKQTFVVNLFGFYTAVSTTDYLKSCTILMDASGQVSITDQVDASRIRASATPYASDAAKLRQALMEDFLCTATYAAVGDRQALQLTAMQSYLDYQQSMGAAEMRQNVCLGYALGLIAPGALEPMLAATPTFSHAAVSALVRYDTAALLALFYKDPATRTARSRQEIESEGRRDMCLFLDPSDPTDAVRLGVLRNDAAWQQMDALGDTAAFGTIPYLSHLGATQMGAVIADWVSIVWWAAALGKVAPALGDTVAALEKAPASDPTKDPAFMKARRNLANVLGAVTRKTDAAFVHGWGAAILFAMSGKRGAAEMDLTWNGKHLHFGVGGAEHG